MEIEILILCAIIGYLLIIHHVDRWKASKRENDLLDRLMSRSHDDYTMNRVRMATVSKKHEFLGKIGSKKDEEDDDLEEEGIPVN